MRGHIVRRGKEPQGSRELGAEEVGLGGIVFGGEVGQHAAADVDGRTGGGALGPHAGRCAQAARKLQQVRAVERARRCTRRAQGLFDERDRLIEAAAQFRQQRPLRQRDRGLLASFASIRAKPAGEVCGGGQALLGGLRRTARECRTSAFP